MFHASKAADFAFVVGSNTGLTAEVRLIFYLT